jgi:hypothetical protein
MSFGNSSVTKWGFGKNVVGANVFENVVNTAVLSNGGSWTNASDVNLKENFKELDGIEILNKVNELKITQWNYKNENADVIHIGPMAQDFYSLFKTGGSDKTISTIDPGGVALISIQQLTKINKNQQKVIETQQTEINDLKTRVEKLEKMILLH